MTHHKLGSKEKAIEYRSLLDDAMKLAKYRDDEDSKSFFAEANEVLGPPASDESEE